MIAEFLTELDLRHVSGLQRPPFPFGALSKRRVPDDLFRSWLHPLRHNPKVRRDLHPQRPGTPGQNVVTSLVRVPRLRWRMPPPFRGIPGSYSGERERDTIAPADVPNGHEVDTSAERLPEAIFGFGQALTRIYDLTLLSRSNVGSTFYDDLADCLTGLVDEAKVQRDFEPDVPNAKAYPVDYRIEGKNGVPLFVYGVPNRDKARLTTIMLGYFHRHKVEFESVIVFADQTEIPSVDLARLSDVGGDLISSLESTEDLNRKLLRRVA